MGDSRTAEELKALGNEAFTAERFADAIQFYSQAIKVDPKNHVFFSNRSASHAGLQQWQSAANDAKECIRLDPTFVKGYYRLAAAQTELKDFDGAMATIRQGLVIDTNNPQLTKQLRMVQQQKKVAQAKSAAMASSVPNVTTGQTLDSATASELQSLRTQYAQASRELHTVQANVGKSQREYKVADLTSKELQQIPDTANCYQSVGKIFLRSTKREVVQLLSERMSTEQKNEIDMTKKVEYLERQVTSLRQNMEELMSGSVAASTE